jgi:hypothetical protein
MRGGSRDPVETIALNKAVVNRIKPLPCPSENRLRPESHRHGAILSELSWNTSSDGLLPWDQPLSNKKTGGHVNATAGVKKKEKELV